MGKSMYQSAFLSFENCLNPVVVGSKMFFFITRNTGISFRKAHL